MPSAKCANEELKLVALDKDDIEVMSAHLQDALVKIGEILWRPGEHRFVMAVKRFDWMNAGDADAFKSNAPEYRRCRTALRFERVVSCKCRGLDQAGKDACSIFSPSNLSSMTLRPEP